jgi:hypothetical protein
MRKIRETLTNTFSGPGGILFVAALLIYLPGIWWGVTRPRLRPWRIPGDPMNWRHCSR